MSLVKTVSSSDCEVAVYNLNENGMEKARAYGVTSVPTVVVDGRILDCSNRRKLTPEDLKAAGVSVPR